MNSLSDFVYSWIEKNYFIVITIAVILCALVIRIPGIVFQSEDYEPFSLWYLYFVEHGFFAFKTIYLERMAFFPPNYSPLFLSIYGFLALLPNSDSQFTIIYVKIVPIVMDFILSFFIYKTVFDLKKDKKIALFAFTAFIMSPLMVINSSVWGQSDILYSTFAIIACIYLFQEKYALAFSFLGVSIALKAMGIFVVPIFIMISVWRKINIKYFFLVPIPHLAASLFACAFGAPFLKVFFASAKGGWHGISRSASNLGMFFSLPNAYTFNYFILLVFTFIFCMVMFHLFMVRKQELSFDKFTLWCLIISLGVPFFMPQMHERYFAVAEYFSILFLFLKPKYWYVTLLVHLPTLARYLEYLSGTSFVSCHQGAFMVLIAFCLLLKALYEEEFKSV